MSRPNTEASGNRRDAQGDTGDGQCCHRKGREKKRPRERRRLRLVTSASRGGEAVLVSGPNASVSKQSHVQALSWVTAGQDSRLACRTSYVLSVASGTKCHARI